MTTAIVDRHARPMSENIVLLDPRAHLTSSEIVHLRRLDEAGAAVKHGKFYVCLGTRYKARTFDRFVILGLAVKSVQGSTLIVRLNYTGRLVVERLRTRPIDGAVSTIDD